MITVDSALSTTSENPVQNKVINSQLQNKVDTGDILTTKESIINATEDQSGKLPTVEHVKDYVDTRVTSVSGMVKFKEAGEDYNLAVNDTTLTLKFNDSFKSQKLKFVKIDDTFTKTNSITGNLNITDGSLIQIGYIDNKKLVLTEPVWVEIQSATVGGLPVKRPVVNYSI